MTQPTEVLPQPSAPPAAPVTDRDIQRATLRDLVALATECAATESEIERRYRAEVEDEKKKFQRLNWDIDNKIGVARDAVRQAREQAVADVVAKFQADSDLLHSQVEEARRKVVTRNDLLRQEVKKKYDHAVWLAESVLENTQNGIAADLKTAKATIEAQLKGLHETELQALQFLATYGMTVEKPGGDEEGPVPAPELGAEIYEKERASAEHYLATLGGMILPKLFVGLNAYLALVLLCVIAGVVTQAVSQTSQPQWMPLAWAAGGTFVASIVLGVLLSRLSKRRLRDTYAPFRAAIAAARGATTAEEQFAKLTADNRQAKAARKRKAEIQAAKDKLAPILSDATRNYDATLQSLESEQTQQLGELEAARGHALAEAQEGERVQLIDLQQRRERDLTRARERHEARLQQFRQQYDEGRKALSSRLHDGLARIRVPVANSDGRMPADWNNPAWKSYTPPGKFPDLIRFGELSVDLRRIADSVPRPAAPARTESSRTESSGNGSEKEGGSPTNGDSHGSRLQMPPAFSVPASIAFPRQASVLVQSDRDGRADAIRFVQMLMARLLTGLPAGRVRFTMIDPIGRGENFAGFMHLADHDDALVGGRIWTEQEQIEHRLADLTEHMETVIQKYLRNEYETIDDYNAQAGELAEPYRFLVIADFPVGFEGDAARRLASIASSGARCGVYTLVMRDTRQQLPSGTHLDELERNSVNVLREGERFVWKDEVFGLFPLSLDPPPPEGVLIKLLDVVGKAAKEAKRVELPFDSIAPTVPQLWSRSCTDQLEVPIGRMGATKLQMLKLGRGVAQHVLIAGKTGSGKSTLLHALVTNLAMWYSPDEVEFYLVDFKKGVEFKTYATHSLPHARAIAVESDREFGLSVLQRLDGELTRRGNLFRRASVQDLAAYRASDGAVPMPRTLLIIDEFQEFFSEDDKLAQDAGVLLDRLVRQGRAFGIHVLLGSQTIGGTSGLARSTLGQMAVRVALQTSEADSQLILGDNNSAARLLSRPGEAIYNDAGGLVEGNSPFQVAWLPDDKREVYLDRVQAKASATKGNRWELPIVFEGNAAADITKNPRLAALLDAPAYPPASSVTMAWLGDPVAIKDPTSITFRRQAGANVLIVGQQEESALAIVAVTVASLAAQQPPGKAVFYVFDGTAADSPLAGTFARLKDAVPHELKLPEWRATGDAINDLAQELSRRQAGEADAPSIYAIFYGLQRYRILRKQEESFSFGSSDEPKPAQPDKQFADLLREGPGFGIHIITWADTPATLERTLDRGSLREFDNRILFQMSANDSSNLIDSPAGNKLGFHRALAYSEEQGVMEKFRPYALPDRAWLQRLRERLTSRKIT
jgi:DNA segregation ATPase FtsK/SpoIIIE, S-DNA-T family